LVTIKELAASVGFKGPAHKRVAEPSSVKTLSPIDNSVPGQATIRTSVDCYVSGQYVQKQGKSVEVTQRYTIYVAYSKETQLATMNKIRDTIMNDFQAKYGGTFNINNVFVQTLPVPVKKDVPVKDEAQPLEMYQGSGLFRDMTRVERARYEIGSQRTQSRLNIESIKKRYRTR